jgi:HSP20 family protein
VHRDLDSLFNRVFADPVGRQGAESYAPPADVRRDGDTWRVSVAVPGISPDDLDIEIIGRTLHVRGERRSDEKTQPILNEISYGRFEREFALPEAIDVRQARATYRHGVLELVLPLAEGAKPHRIKVEAAPETRQLQAA